MTRKITYSDIKRILTGLGYKMEEVKGSHRIFSHTRKESVIILPYRALSEAVDRTRLALVRHVLVITDVVAPEAFTDLYFQNALKNGHARTKARRRAVSKA